MSDVLFEVDGFEVKKNTVYIVKDKLDLSAPSGIQEEGATKVPSEGIGDTFRAPFDIATNVFDTGLYEYSACYKGKPREAVKLIVQNLRDNVIEPYMQSKGIESFEELSHKNLEFWDENKFYVDRKTFFNTSDPIDAFKLYYTLRQRRAAPKEKLKEPIYNLTEYLLVENSRDLKISEQRSQDRRRANAAYLELETNKGLLVDVLLYMNLRVSTSKTSEAIYLDFENKILSSPQKVEEFLRVIDKVTTERGREEIIIHSILRNPKNSKEVKTNAGNMVEFKGVELGPDYKSAAKKLTYDKDLEDLKGDLLFLEDED